MKRVGKSKFVFSILRKSDKFNSIKNLVLKNFRILKIIEEEKDSIFFCQKTESKTIRFIYRK